MRLLSTTEMCGLGTTPGVTLIVLATRAPTPPSACFLRVIPSLVVGPGAVIVGFLRRIPAISTERSTLLKCAISSGRV